MSEPATSTEPTKQTTIHFPESLRKSLRGYAGQLDQSMNQFVIEAVQEKIARMTEPSSPGPASAGE